MLPYSTTYATLIRLIITCSKYCDLSAATWYTVRALLTILLLRIKFIYNMCRKNNYNHHQQQITMY